MSLDPDLAADVLSRQLVGVSVDLCDFIVALVLNPKPLALDRNQRPRTPLCLRVQDARLVQRLPLGVELELVIELSPDLHILLLVSGFEVAGLDGSVFGELTLNLCEEGVEHFILLGLIKYCCYQLDK